MLTVPGFETPFRYTKNAAAKKKEQNISEQLIIETLTNPVRISKVTKYPHQKRYHSDRLSIVVDENRIIALFLSN